MDKAIEELRNERIQNMVDAVSFKEPKKIPVGLEMSTWAFAYTGKTYKEVMHDPYLAAETYLKFLDDMEFDWFALGTGVPQYLPLYEALECKDYALAHDDTMIQHIQSAGQYMSVEEYPMLIEDPYGFSTEVMPRKNYKIFNGPKDKAYEALKKAATGYKDFLIMNDLINKGCYADTGTLTHMGPYPGFNSSLTFVFDNLRGMVNTLGDIRRRPELLDAACEAIAKMRYTPLPDIDTFVGNPFPWGSSVYHVECFLSPPLYDKYYFNDLKNTLTPYLEKGSKIFLKGEGQFLDTVERFRELPKGSVIMMLDQDDPFEVYKKIGDWQIITAGFSADLLKVGTLEQCKDYAKRCLDTFAPGGGFLFNNNKPLLGGKDTQPDKLRELVAYVNEISRK
ncbi:MAG: hypothetical protein FWG30_04630 [Eubacteriaceae bacterium]|nr:hypothetical protein [Eubacteriaceae bacterium]